MENLLILASDQKIANCLKMVYAEQNLSTGNCNPLAGAEGLAESTGPGCWHVKQTVTNLLSADFQLRGLIWESCFFESINSIALWSLDHVFGLWH